MQEQQDKRSINSLIEQKFVPPVPSAAQTNFLGLNVFFFFLNQEYVIILGISCSASHVGLICKNPALNLCK